MQNIIQNLKTNYRLAIIFLLGGLFIGWLVFHTGKSAVSEKADEIHNHDEAEHQEWTCSMHPQIRQEEPGDCPICGMDLIPLTKSDDNDLMHPDEISFSESAAGLADIRTIRVARSAPAKVIRLQGKVEADERKIYDLTARFGGRVEELFINYTGQAVKKGDKLASLYSPELINAQKELIEAYLIRDRKPGLYEAARKRLESWDLTAKQIKEIEQSGEALTSFDILAPVGGTVLMRHIAKGNYIKEGEVLFRIADLSEVWVVFDAYERDLPWISVGDRVEMGIASLPGESFSSKISFIDPVLNTETRTVGLRINLPNAGNRIKPGMFAEAELHSGLASEKEEIVIPKSAVLWTGTRSVIYTKVPDRESPVFRYREIVIGPETGDSYIVMGGLEEGEEIAVNGVFRIDAAAQLEGKTSMMNPGGEKMDIGHNHGHDSGNQGMEDKSMREMVPATDTPDAFREMITAVYRKYIIMKDALVESDALKTGEAARSVKAELEDVDGSLLEGDSKSSWNSELKLLEKNIGIIINAGDLEKQRLAFSEFNNAFYKVIKQFGLLETGTYYQYCPMANGDKGAYWFSNEEEIRNPYFGDMMLSCGEVREIIK